MPIISKLVHNTNLARNTHSTHKTMNGYHSK